MQRDRKCVTCCGRDALLRWAKVNAQLIAIVVAIVIGLILGVIIQRTDPSEETLMWLGFPGEIFLRVFNACIMPLIVFGVISGASSMAPKSNGRAGGIALGFSLVLTMFSSLIGLLLCLAIKPGSFMKKVGISRNTDVKLRTLDIFADMARNVFADNIARATIQKTRTEYFAKATSLSSDVTLNGLATSNMTEAHGPALTRTLVYADTTNLVGLMFFCVVFGIAVGRLGKMAAVLHEFTDAGRGVMILILQSFMWYCPIGVASLIISALARQRDLGTVMARLSMLMLTSTLGNVLQCLLLYPLIFFAATRKSPVQLMLRCGRLATMAFTLDSSILVMPEYYRVCAAQHYDKRLTSMVVPLIATISSSGSALFISVATLFLIQYSSVPVDASQLAVIVTLGALSCFALPAAPSSSIIVVTLILQTVNVPTELVGILFSIDWFLDRVRTVANAISKVVGAALVNELCQEQLQQMDEEQQQQLHGETQIHQQQMGEEQPDAQMSLLDSDSHHPESGLSAV